MSTLSINRSKLVTFTWTLILLTLITLILVGVAISTLWPDYFAERSAELLILNLICISILGLLIVMYLVRLLKQKRQGVPGTRLAVRILRVFAVLILSSLSFVYIFSFLSINQGIDSWFDPQMDDALEEAKQLRGVFIDSLESKLVSDLKGVIEELKEISADAKLDEYRKKISDILFDARVAGNYEEITYFRGAPTLTGFIASSGLQTDSLVLAPQKPSGKSPQQALSDADGTTAVGSQSELVPQNLNSQVPFHSGSSAVGIQFDSAAQQFGTVGQQPIENLMQQTLSSSGDVPVGEILEINNRGYLKMLLPFSIASEIGTEKHYLQVVTRLHQSSERLAEKIGSIDERYRRLGSLRSPLKYSLALTLTFVTLIALQLAIWAAIKLTQRLVSPIQILSEGTQEVAKGNYEQSLPVTTRDEFGVLVESFNDMTKKIKSSQEQLRKSRAIAEEQRSYLEIVWQHLSSGVLFIDRNSFLTNINLAAENILGVDADSVKDRSLDYIIQHNEHLAPLFSPILDGTANKQNDWNDTASLGTNRGQQILAYSATQLPASDAVSGSYVVVVEDITSLIEAQRAVAWGEVARRVAHELLNPLQPIHLAVDRIKRKAVVLSEDKESLKLTFDSIYRQLDSMQRLVNEFRDYEKLKDPRPSIVDLNKLIREVVVPYTEGEQSNGVILQLDPELKEFSADTNQLVQVLNNLLINARDAVYNSENPAVTIHTEQVEPDTIRMRFVDNGPGFDKELLDRVFEPYATTKERGTGLGLGIVKRIVEGHGGKISAGNHSDGGAEITIEFDTRFTAVQI